MVQIHLLAAKKDDGPIYRPRMNIINMTQVDGLYFMVMEGGMISGEPSVMIAAEPRELHRQENLTPSGEGWSVLFQTSLDKFLAAAAGLRAMAETQFGWESPEGHFSILPDLPKEVRERMLESLRAELEEMGDD